MKCAGVRFHTFINRKGKGDTIKKKIKNQIKCIFLLYKFANIHIIILTTIVSANYVYCVQYKNSEEF